MCSDLSVCPPFSRYIYLHMQIELYIYGVVRWNHQLLQIHRNVNAFENWPLCVFCSLCSGHINKLTFSHPNISFHKPPPHPSSLPPLHCMLISPVNVMRVSIHMEGYKNNGHCGRNIVSGKMSQVTLSPTELNKYQQYL